jgi:hypothetical protein
MRWLACAAMLALPLDARAGEPSGAESPGVLVLASAGDRARDAVLVDALRIYLRDRGRAVRLGGAAPDSMSAEALGRVLAETRRSGAEVAVWFGERDGAPRLYALRVASSEVRETPVEPDDPLLAARTLALKVRALFSTRTDEAAWSVPPEAAPVPEINAWADQVDREALERETAPLPPPAVEPRAPSPPVVVRAAPRPPRRAWLEAAVAYGATVPTRTDWVRHGLWVRLTMPLGRLPLGAFVDAAFTTEPSTTVDGSQVAARVWPIGAGVLARWRRGRWQLAAGPRVSLQIVDAHASAADGRSGGALRYGAGLGLLGEVAWLFSRHVGAVATVGAEALVPRLALAAGGSGSTDLGWVQFAFSAGLVVSVP